MAGSIQRAAAPVSFRVGTLQDVDRVLRNLDRRMREVEASAHVQGKLFKAVELPDSADKALFHGLGRTVSVFVSPVLDNGATGRVERISAVASPDERNWIVLKGTGFSATIKVDVWVM